MTLIESISRGSVEIKQFYNITILTKKSAEKYWCLFISLRYWFSFNSMSVSNYFRYSAKNIWFPLFLFLIKSKTGLFESVREKC